MMQKYRWFFFAALAILFSCKTTQQQFTDTSSLQTESADISKFRSFFYQELGDAQISTQDFNKIILTPPASLFSHSGASTSEDFLADRAKIFKSIAPKDLYAPATPLPNHETLSPLNDSDVPTFILLPGIFGEFISTTPMSEVMTASEDSSLAKDFAKAVAAQINTSLSYDSFFSMQQLKTVNAPLGDFLDLATMNDQGKPLFHFIGLKMPFFGLESIGTLESSADIYIRRLNKLFQLIPPSKNIYLIGYSRGLCVGLELLSQGQRLPWINQIKGLVSLGGDIYGSDVADQTDEPGSKSNLQIAGIRELTQNLSEGEGIVTFTKNTAAWTKFLAKMSTLGMPISLTDTAGTDIRASSVLFKKVWNQLNLSHFVSDYANNVKRFRLFAQAALIAIDGLKTKERLQWWKTHTVPSQIDYYALSATMTDPDKDGDVAKNPRSYDVGSVDYKTLLSTYRDNVREFGLRLNDSQMTLDKAIFWSEIHPLLNPQQQPFKTHFLGLMNSHHWGLTLKVVTETTNKQLNPFPRVTMMKALARSLVTPFSSE